MRPAAFGCPGHQLFQVHSDREVLIAHGGEHERPDRGIVPRVGDGLLDGVHVLERHAAAGWIVVGQRQTRASECRRLNGQWRAPWHGRAQRAILDI